MSKNSTGKAHKFWSMIGIVLCVILTPILIMNLTLLAKSYINRDQVPSIGGRLPLIVLTDSMYPEIQSGDLIVCSVVDAEQIGKNDVIAFFDPAGNGTSVVTHRVVEVFREDGNLFFRTKGDYNNAQDREPVPAKNLVGRYDFRIPGAGDVAIFMQSSTGLILCVVVPILLLVGYDVIRRRIYERTSREDTDALLAELEALKAEKALRERTAAEDRTE